VAAGNYLLLMEQSWPTGPGVGVGLGTGYVRVVWRFVCHSEVHAGLEKAVGSECGLHGCEK
jgi:hypothetical protein